MSNTLGKKAVECALRSVGVREEAPNDGRWIRVYLRFCGIFFPAAWCSAYSSYKIHQAANELGVKSRWPKHGYVQTVFNWCKLNTTITVTPKPYCVFVTYYPSLGRYAHIGFIADVRNGGREYLTVEGNSNTDGSREGTAVVSMWRKWDKSRHRCIEIV